MWKSKKVIYSSSQGTSIDHCRSLLKDKIKYIRAGWKQPDRRAITLSVDKLLWLLQIAPTLTNMILARSMEDLKTEIMLALASH